MIEFAQCRGIDNRRTALQRRALPGTRGQNAAKQDKDGDKKSQRQGPYPDERRASETPIRDVLRATSSIQEISRKADGLSRQSGSGLPIASRRSEVIGI